MNILLAVAGVLAAALAPSAAWAETLKARVDAAVNRAAARGFAGEVLVGDASGRVLHARAVGLADRANRRPHRNGQLWRWASVSKQVTAALAMAEVDAGRLRLDAAVTDYLPSFGGPTGRAITIRHLLQHLSGLPNPSDGAPNANSMPPFYGRSGDVGGLADAMGVCAGAPKGAPGASFAYNNCDYIVLGAILERVSGRTYAQLVRERLAKPLALRSVEAARRGRPGVAGYDEVGAGELPYNLATFGPGGAIVGTARDLLKFDAALLSRRAVSPASTAVMWAGEPKFGYAALGAWSFPAALRGCAGSVQLVERRGAIGGVQVRNILAPSLGRSLVVFANTGKLEFGEVWQGKGLSYDLLSAAFCEGAAPAK